jgi:hypothetical protein
MEPTDELLQPLSLEELHDLRRRILHDEGFEPDVETMKRVVQAVRVARPLPEEKPKRKAKTPAEKIDLSDLL